ncbi:unnamed protein product [Orchesella dallaii]|uniref:Uncharacterized protein n=1 Tax=Orchesella dallaii TaxID=48710 RepID=A0ABP1SA17_9HEXA
MVMMRSCYEKVKSKLGPRLRQPLLVTRSSARHAKCLKPYSSSVSASTSSSSANSKSRMRKQENGSSISSTSKEIVPGTGPIVQIRSLPLHLSQIRCPVDRSLRSSYIINSEKVRDPPNIRRTRSLSPEILRTTGKEPLKSPLLVRGAVSLKKPSKSGPGVETGTASKSYMVKGRSRFRDSGVAKKLITRRGTTTASTTPRDSPRDSPSKEKESASASAPTTTGTGTFTAGKVTAKGFPSIFNRSPDVGKGTTRTRRGGSESQVKFEDRQRVPKALEHQKLYQRHHGEKGFLCCVYAVWYYSSSLEINVRIYKFGFCNSYCYSGIETGAFELGGRKQDENNLSF